MTSPPQKPPFSEINIVPYIDVMLVLLIIFMLTTPLLQNGIPVNLPDSSSQALPQEEIPPLLLTVDSQGQLYWQQDKQPLPHAEILQQIQQYQAIYPTATVLIRGDQQASYGQIMQAIDLLYNAGVTRLGLMTEGN